MSESGKSLRFVLSLGMMLVLSVVGSVLILTAIAGAL